MRDWTGDELALAVKLTSVQGYEFDETAEIMSRNGYPDRTAEDVEDKIRTDAPVAWSMIKEAKQKRENSRFHGLAAPPPRKLYQGSIDTLIDFITSYAKGLSEDQLCWEAQKFGFKCNITDIRISARRAGYELAEPEDGPQVSYEQAFDQGGCLWPVGKGVCGKDREEGRYCGPHYCRSLGSHPA